MTKKWEKLTEKFDATSANGQQFHLLVYTTMIDARSMGEPNAAPLEGLKTVRTSDGQVCNHIDDNTFEIVALGLRVTRV